MRNHDAVGRPDCERIRRDEIEQRVGDDDVRLAVSLAHAREEAVGDDATALGDVLFDELGEFVVALNEVDLFRVLGFPPCGFQ